MRRPMIGSRMHSHCDCIIIQTSARRARDRAAATVAAHHRTCRSGRWHRRCRPAAACRRGRPRPRPSAVTVIFGRVEVVFTLRVPSEMDGLGLRQAKSFSRSGGTFAFEGELHMIRRRVVSSFLASGPPRPGSWPPRLQPERRRPGHRSLSSRPVRFGKGPTEKDPNHEHLAGPLHFVGGG